MTVPNLGASAQALLARTNSMHYTADGRVGLPLGSGAITGGAITGGAEEGGGFESALLKAMDGVNDYQNRSSDLMERMVVDPDSVDPHDVTIAMSEANLSLNIARTILDRVVRGWKEVINTR